MLGVALSGRLVVGVGEFRSHQRPAPMRQGRVVVPLHVGVLQAD